MNTNESNPGNPQQPPSQPAQAASQPQQQSQPQHQSQQSPRARMQALLAIGDRDRTDAEWDELNELEILMAPGNREGSTMPTARRGNTGPMQSGRREMQGPRPGGGGGGNAGGGGGNGPGNGGNPQGKRAGGKKFHRGPRKPNTQNNPPRQG